MDAKKFAWFGFEVFFVVEDRRRRNRSCRCWKRWSRVRLNLQRRTKKKKKEEGRDRLPSPERAHGCRLHQDGRLRRRPLTAVSEEGNRRRGTEKPGIWVSGLVARGRRQLYWIRARSGPGLGRVRLDPIWKEKDFRPV